MYMVDQRGVVGIDDGQVADAWKDVPRSGIVEGDGPRSPAGTAAAAAAAPATPGAAARPGAKPAADTRPALAGMTLADMQERLAEWGEPAFRARQLYRWVYSRRALSFDEMTDMSKTLREHLAREFRLHPLRLADRKPSGADGSAKLLFGLDDGRYVEGVLMPDHGRLTLCVSSQVGCAVDCKFCLTGLMGFQRNLTAGEIVSQAILASRDPLASEPSDEREPNAPPLTNIVFMGMGEPLLNPRGVLGAIRLLTDTSGLGMGLSPRRVTVSTAGVVPGIDRLSEAELGVKLAISLNGTTEEQRSMVMPITRTYGLEDLMAALRRYRLPRTHRITFEYVMLAGINDQLDDARRLVKLVHGLRTKINLIPFNPDSALPFQRPTREAAEAFQQILLDAGLTVSIRWSKGLDVDAACGQLAGRWRPPAEVEA